MYTPFKYSNAKIQLSSENLQHAYEKSNTTENSGILHCCGYWVFCHYWNAFFFPPSISFFFFFSSHLLSSFSVLVLYTSFLLWWCIPSIPLLACFLFTLSVYMPLSFSLHVTFPMVSSAMGSVFCPTNGPLLQESVLFFSVLLLIFFF